MDTEQLKDALERALVRHGAPTLLGAKAANLFTFRGNFCADDDGALSCPHAAGCRAYRRRRALAQAICACDRALAGDGVRVTVLAWRSFGALVYVYRPACVRRRLADARVARVLADQGYEAARGVAAALARLRSRLDEDGFPHEIGFFLGYPYEDVAGFIDNAGRGYRLCGCWKVYGDVRWAQRAFARYRRCTRRCQELYARGARLAELASPYGVRVWEGPAGAGNGAREKRACVRRDHEMAKIAVVYWSGTGNTEAMAELVAEGAAQAGGEAVLVAAAEFSQADLDAYDGFAFGCPAMGSEELESEEFEPMWDDVEPHLPGRRVALFGSYDWADGEWMDLWRERAEAAGITVEETVIAKDYPDDAAAEACRKLGASLV